VAGTCGYGEEISGYINAGNFLTSCKVYCWIIKKDSPPWSKCVNVLYILCIGHLPDIVSETAKQCGGLQYLVMEVKYSKDAFSIQFIKAI
jgi:hypothetical protein